MIPTPPIIRKSQVKEENPSSKSPAQGGALSANPQGGAKMKTRKANSPRRRKQTQKRQAKSTKRNAITWTDPSVRRTRVSKRRKSKLSKNDMKKNSCWWLG
jgi:hypothetical protein